MPDASETDDKVQGTYERVEQVRGVPQEPRTDSTNTVVRTLVVKVGSSRVVLRYAPHSAPVPPDETSVG
jgi:hypothetical protein